MLNHRPRKRAPLRQLREAAFVAYELLVKKGVVHKDNILEKIAQDASAPILPGLPSYLPHKWTIQAARKAMHELLKEWLNKHPKNFDKQENAPEFFAFAVKRLQILERKYTREMRQTEKTIHKIKKAPLIYEIFSPVRRRDTTQALHKFFVDSFAVFVIVKENGNTTEYAEWFLGEWTPALDSMWKKREDKEEVKIND